MVDDDPAFGQGVRPCVAVPPAAAGRPEPAPRTVHTARTAPSGHAGRAPIAPIAPIAPGDAEVADLPGFPGAPSGAPAFSARTRSAAT